MTNEEYLKLFENVNNQNQNLNETSKYDDYKNMNLNETPNYNQYQSLNETPDVSQFKIDENLNDGWNLDVQFETRINGELQNPNSIYEQKRRRYNKSNDLNGLNQYLEDENLNEVYRNNSTQTLNESINTDCDVVTLDMFNNMRKNSMLAVANLFK
jgi:hypothetical protein